MDNKNFKNLLLETAVSAIACDGSVDDREIDALRSLEKNSPYFSSDDLSKNLDKFLKNCEKNLQKFQTSLFNKIKKTKLNILQELTLMEISLRIISADEKEENDEINFIKMLRSNLSISDLILYQRFGKIEYLGILDLEENFVEFKDNDESDNIINT